MRTATTLEFQFRNKLLKTSMFMVNFNVDHLHYTDGTMDNVIHRGSYIQVLLNLLKELGNSYKMRGLSSISSLFCNKFNKFNNT